MHGAADTWHAGRFLEQWADPRAVEGLRQAYAHYDAGEVKSALWATLALFHGLAVETGEKLGCAYPAEAEGHVSDLVKSILP